MYWLMKFQSIKDIALLGRFVHHCSGWVLSRERFELETKRINAFAK